MERLRGKVRVDYKALSKGTERLPRATHCRNLTWSTTKLYKLEVIGEKIVDFCLYYNVHYVGWPEKYDEWRQASDVVLLHEEQIFNNPFHHHLRVAIKENLTSRRIDTLVQLSIPIQKNEFKTVSKLGIVKRGNRRTITS